MYKPELKYTSNGVPVVSNKELDQIGERMAIDFDPSLLLDPHPVDIDRFIEKYLGLHLDYMYLSHCGVYLGTMVFQTTDRLPVYIPEEHCAEYAHVDAGTVIIDSSLEVEEQEHRYRFTAGHEGSHGILHPSYFLNSIGSERRDETGIYVRCRADFRKCRQSGLLLPMSDDERVEQQANRLSAAILMPQNSVKLLFARDPYNRKASWIFSAVDRMSKVFNVSAEAAFYRLKALEIIDDSAQFLL